MCISLLQNEQTFPVLLEAVTEATPWKCFWCRPPLLFHKQADHLQGIHYAETKLVASVGASLLVITTMTYSLEKRLELELLYNINPRPERGRRERDLICFPPYAILPLIETFPVGLCFDSETFEKLWLWQSFVFWPRKKLPCVYRSLHLS